MRAEDKAQSEKLKAEMLSGGALRLLVTDDRGVLLDGAVCVELRRWDRLQMEDDKLKALMIAMAMAGAEVEAQLVKKGDKVELLLKNEDSRVSRLYGALWDYHHSLDMREHEGVASNKLVRAIEGILGVRWEQGATLKEEGGRPE